MQEIPKEIQSFIHELEQLGEDKLVQPNGQSRRAYTRAAKLIKELYATESPLDR